MIWYDVIWYDMIWYGIWYGVIWVAVIAAKHSEVAKFDSIGRDWLRVANARNSG